MSNAESRVIGIFLSSNLLVCSRIQWHNFVFMDDTHFLTVQLSGTNALEKKISHVQSYGFLFCFEPDSEYVGHDQATCCSTSSTLLVYYRTSDSSDSRVGRPTSKTDKEFSS
ncbi:hypothetical protein AVEN_45297-1 [Araneus ventricosus]|uniref:Uncharacterized protein n=1 Tax=Araneus ventricosus TaxID=182803 RepID=A0A4Y2J3I0_ARAVE|nr:hypothetical protein AVEN_45297-1 [Araneus ventricosus]